MHKDTVVTSSIEAIALLLTAPNSLDRDSSFDLASLFCILPSKMSPSNELDEEDRPWCLQVLAAIICGFRTFLDHSSAMIMTGYSKIVQEYHYASTDKDFCQSELIVIQKLTRSSPKYFMRNSVCYILDW